jgi:hypothetical protein
MRNGLLLITALMVGSAMIGCSNSDAPAESQKTTPIGGGQGSLGWALKLQSKCQDNIAPEYCIAGQGFTVKTDGQYEIGPGPNGQSKTGTISSDELSNLTAALAPVLSSGVQTENHESLQVEASDEEPAQASDDTLTLTRGSGNSEVLAQVTADDLAFRTASSEQAKTLMKTLKNLAVKYYATPFPDTCSDSSSALLALYGTIQTCSADADCSYYDDNLNVVDANSNAVLTTDDCTVAKPLVVGNTTLVDQNRTKIAELFSEISNACSGRMMRADCTEATTIALSGKSAVCNQGVCTAAKQTSSFNLRSY